MTSAERDESSESWPSWPVDGEDDSFPVGNAEVHPPVNLLNDNLMSGDHAFVASRSGSMRTVMDVTALDPEYELNLGYAEDVSGDATSGLPDSEEFLNVPGIANWMISEQMRNSQADSSLLAVSRKFNLLAGGSFATAENYSFALQAAYQQVPKRAKLQPLWETNPFLAPIFGHPKQLFQQTKLEGYPVQPDLSAPVPLLTQNQDWVLTDRATFTKAVGRSKDLTWEESEDYRRQKAINRMIAIFNSGPEHTQLGRKVLAELGSSAINDKSKVFGSVCDSVARKATSTLLNRTGAFVKYMFFCKKNLKPVWPLDESLCYSYVSMLKTEKAAASKARSFLQAIGFLKGVLDPDGASEVIDSARCQGSSFSQAVQKRKTKRRRRLKVKEVNWLETVCNDSPDMYDRVFTGFQLFLIFGRARRGDTVAIKRLTVDFRGKTDGFIQADADHVKQGRTVEKRQLFLPLTALRQGLRSKPWADSWMAARAALNLPSESDDGRNFPMMPAPNLSGGWTKRPLSSTESKKWLIEILKLGDPNGPEDPGDLGGHTGRHTGMAWASLIGVSHPIRKFLAYHIDSADSTMAVYGRDNAAEPLRQFKKTVMAIREGVFDPDSTRSGYMSGALAQLGFEKWYPGAPLGECELMDDEDPEAPNSPSSSSESSGSSDSSDDSSDADDASAKLGKSLAPLRGCGEPEIKSGLLYFHSVFTTVHKLKSQGAASFHCGRILRVGYERVQEQTFDWPKCRTCFPP